MAVHFHAQVTMLHAVELPPTWYGDIALDAYAAAVNTDDLMQDCRKTLDAYLRAPDALCRARRVVIEGDPAEVITNYAREQKTDLIMMPTHGYGPFRRFLIGSVAAKVLHDVECPVWTDVHHELTCAPQRDGTVLYAMDPHEENLAPLRWAADYAASMGAPLTLLHVIPPAVSGPHPPEEGVFQRFLIDSASARIDDLKRRAGVNASVRIEIGSISSVVREVARLESAGLIVIGQGCIHETFGGLRTHAYGIIREAPCPVVRV
jgi:nucleotide-binding universal stress UspA family protein